MRWLVCLFCLNPLLAMADVITCTDFPCDIFPTAVSMGIHGQPRSVEHESEFSFFYDTSRYRFNKEGLLLEKRLYRDEVLVGGGGYKADLRRGSLEGAWEYSGEYGDRDNGSSMVIKKRDERGRPTYVKTESQRDDGLIATISQQSVAQIIYFPRARLKSYYVQTPQGVQKPSTERREYDERGGLAASCLIKHESQGCDDGFSVQRFSQFGQISDKGPFADIKYEYEDGQLARKIVGGELSADPAITRYSEYRVDVCGNWISRRVTLPAASVPGLASETTVAVPAQQQVESPEAFHTFVETRDISYYDHGKECGQGSDESGKPLANWRNE